MSRPHRRRRLAVRALLVTLALASGGAGGWTAARYAAPLPALTETVSLTAAQTIGGTAPAVPVPPVGSFELADTQRGSVAAHAADTVRPIASVAKTMTALAVLDAHPLTPGSDGPVITVTVADIAVLHQVMAVGGTFAPVTAGEQLTERQLLLGMMLPSANNFAIMLGRWVDGTDASFVARLNAMALKLGMTRTHFADADGLDAATVSTADELVILGRAAIANATLAEIMSHPDATLPGGTVVHNLDTLVGTVPGWLGVKTGHTFEGGYCLLFAVQRSVAAGTPPVTVVGAVLGQAQRQDTFNAARAAVDADFAGYVALTLDTQIPASATVTSAWGSSTVVRPVSSNITALVSRGSSLTLSFSDAPQGPSLRAGDPAGHIIATVDGKQIADVHLVTAGGIDEPTWWWRLRR